MKKTPTQFITAVTEILNSQAIENLIDIISRLDSVLVIDEDGKLHEFKDYIKKG